MNGQLWRSRTATFTDASNFSKFYFLSRKEIIPFSSWEAPKKKEVIARYFWNQKNSFKLHCLILRWFFHISAIYRQAGRTVQDHLREGTKSRITKPRVQVGIHTSDHGDSTDLRGVQQFGFSSEGASSEVFGDQSKT